VRKGAVDVGLHQALDGAPVVSIVVGSIKDGDVILEVDGGCAVVEGLLSVSVGDQHAHERVLLDTLLQGCEVRAGRLDGKVIFELVDGANDDGVVEAEILTTDGAAFVGA